MSAPAAILATTSGYKDMADGTLRLTVDIEPAHAEMALKLFRGRGTPIALARITNEAAVAHDRRQQETPRGSAAGQGGEAAIDPAVASPSAQDRKPMPLASKIALTCRDPEFHEFLRTDPSGFAMEWTRPNNDGASPTEIAETLVKWWCSVSRKRDIEASASAVSRWRELYRDFQQWLGSRALAQRTGRAA